MNFDGVAISGQGAVANGVRLFGTLGAIPVFNTELNFGTRNAPTIIDPETGGAIGTGRPFKSEDRYLFAAQAGFEFNPTEPLNVTHAGDRKRVVSGQRESVRAALCGRSRITQLKTPH